MKILIIAVLLFLSNSNTVLNKPINGCLQMDIMLLGDFSSSVYGYEAFVSGALSEFVNQFDLSEDGIKIGAVTFTSTGNLICPLTSNKTLLKNKVDSLQFFRSSGSTNMLSAIKVAVNQFATNGRQDYKKMIIIISDGEPDAEDEVLKLAKEIKETTSIGICGILILMKEEDDSSTPDIYQVPTYSYPIGKVNRNGNKTMREISSEFCYVESNYENLIKELKKLDICI